MMTREELKPGTLVVSPEHPRLGTVGKVLRVMPAGVQIEWTTPPQQFLPFGCINLEFWMDHDFSLLHQVETPAA